MKSDLPVATINAPASLASSGIISGVGFANAKINGLGAIDFTISYDNAPATDTPTNILAPLIISFKLPSSLLWFVIAANLFLYWFIFLGLPIKIAPDVSQIIVFLMPSPSNSSQMAKPAALMSDKLF